MDFFDDCDKILKIHYDHFFKGPLDENHNQIWHQLDQFYKICEKELTNKNYGYTQAVHHQLISDGHLASIGELNDITHKVHRVTPKGFAFVINGGYKQQIKNEQEKLKLNRISANGATMGWIVAAILGGLQLYQGHQNDKEFTELKRDLPQIQLRLTTDSLQNQRRLIQRQIPEKNSDSVGLPTKTTKDNHKDK